MRHRIVALSVLLAGALALNVSAQEHKDDHPEIALPKRAVCVIMPTKGNETHGLITLTAREGGVHLQGEVSGLEPGLHGFHIHEFGDVTAPDATSAGGHFNPEGHKHGGPDDKDRHAGDLGNIKAGNDGVAKVDIMAKGLKLHFVVGRSLVVHAKADDLKTDPSGDSGARIGVGIIGIASDKEK